MRNPILGNHATMALLVLCGLLMLTVFAEVSLQGLATDAADAENPETSIKFPETVGTVFVPRRFDDYSQILERPLMFADRKMPPEPEVAAEPTKPRSPLRLKLEGVAISADTRVALLRNTSDNRLLQLAEGSEHDGWTLEKLGTSHAIFRRGKETTEIAMEVAAGDRRR